MPIYPSKRNWLGSYRSAFNDFKPRLANLRLRIDDLAHQVNYNSENRSYRYGPLREILGNQKMTLTKALNYFEALSRNATEEVKTTDEYRECLKFIEGIQLYIERVGLLSRVVNQRIEGK
ncbi:hypothetical protein P7H94_10450 [Lactococcus lactis]|uniref:hypothetical protein n=1 Tax=Lactococcus lactis TaxID=1358 RepID=UPI00289080F0|nr:hypothetical protein [Lactococcus lactis]MDT2884907.1 hypothetical protein [Lactococcus lactis]MDT2922359.1 hypothetical protein [Lactococcus lactis]MDT2941394.1 hypothetical protein [Lactococcus lactis]